MVKNVHQLAAVFIHNFLPWFGSSISERGNKQMQILSCSIWEKLDFVYVCEIIIV
jgi:hypothetical protein